jgi:hypothetical protein
MNEYCNGLDYGESFDPYELQLRDAGQMSSCAALWSGESSIMDMSGNAEEWMKTVQYIGDGTALYAIKGGSYNDLGEGMTCDFSLSKADGENDIYRMDNLGFRCCRMDMRCSSDGDCLDNFWCDTDVTPHICKEANTREHCGDGSDGYESCSDYERCAGSIAGCVSCGTDEYCGATCQPCEGATPTCYISGSTSYCGT